MLWLIPFLCSGAICWLNRERIGAAVAPSRVMPVARFGARPLASPYLLPRAVAGYGSTPYGTGQLLLPPGPAASPFAYADAGRPMPMPLPSEAPAPAPPATPIALLRCSGDGCMIRPEPRAWDDATLGRMPGAFTAPKDFPVYVLSYGPVGWAHVLVSHPDEGAVEGWVETRSLTDAAPTPAAASAAPAPGMSPTSASTPGAPSTGQVVSNGREEAMARHFEFMQKRGQGQSGRAAPPPPPPRRRSKR